MQEWMREWWRDWLIQSVDGPIQWGDQPHEKRTILHNLTPLTFGRRLCFFLKDIDTVYPVSKSLALGQHHLTAGSPFGSIDDEREMQDRVLCFTPSSAQVNDWICILFGCNTPMVLRPLQSGKECRRFQLLDKQRLTGSCMEKLWKMPKRIHVTHNFLKLNEMVAR